MKIYVYNQPLKDMTGVAPFTAAIVAEDSIEAAWALVFRVLRERFPGKSFSHHDLGWPEVHLIPHGISLEPSEIVMEGTK